MTNEVELKLAVPEGSVIHLGSQWRRLEERHFEDNLLFDRDAALLRREQVLRLRSKGDRWVLTFKGPAVIDRHGIKTRQECETRVQDGDQARAILEALGYRVSFRYQKWRSTYQRGRVQLMIDETPMGNFLELEGDRDAIRAARDELGMQSAIPIELSYVQLYLKSRTPQQPRDMVFESHESLNQMPTFSVSMSVCEDTTSCPVPEKTEENS